MNIKLPRPIEIILLITVLVLNTFGIIIFAYLFIHSYQGWEEIYNLTTHDFNAQSLWLSILISIITSTLYFVEKFINGITDMINQLKGGNNDGKKRTI